MIFTVRRPVTSYVRRPSWSPAVPNGPGFYRTKFSIFFEWPGTFLRQTRLETYFKQFRQKARFRKDVILCAYEGTKNYAILLQVYEGLRLIKQTYPGIEKARPLSMTASPAGPDAHPLAPNAIGYTAPFDLKAHFFHEWTPPQWSFGFWQ